MRSGLDTHSQRLGRGSYRLEGCNLLFAVRAEVVLQIVDRHAPSQRTEQGIRVLWHALIRPVAVLEVHDCGPIVGEVFGEAARRARGLVANVAIHAGIERISTNDLVQMRRGDVAGLDGISDMD